MFSDISTLPLGTLLQPKQGKGKITRQVPSSSGKLISKLFNKMPAKRSK
jgi:hypothetical protein